VTAGKLTVAAATLAVLLALLLITAPARLIPRLPGTENLVLAGLSGSLWQGEAARAVLLTTAGPVHLGRLRWRLHPLSLITLAPRLQVGSDWGAQRFQGQLRLRGTTLQLRQVDASLDAALARQLLPVGLRGRLSLQLEALDWNGSRLTEAAGSLVWQQAAWESRGALKALGSYAARLDSDGDGLVTARIETLAGPVQASGSLVLNGLLYSITARITSDGAMDPELAQALSLVAVPEENGYLLRLDGALASSP
jgi:general secretion pathway protein N